MTHAMFLLQNDRQRPYSIFLNPQADKLESDLIFSPGRSSYIISSSDSRDVFYSWGWGNLSTGIIASIIISIIVSVLLCILIPVCIWCCVRKRRDRLSDRPVVYTTGKPFLKLKKCSLHQNRAPH